MSVNSELHEDLARFSATLGTLWTQLSQNTDPRQVESQYDQILQLDAHIQHNVNIIASRMRKQARIRELHKQIAKNTEQLNKFFVRGQALEQAIQETLMSDKTPFMFHFTTRADLIRYYNHVNELIRQSYMQDDSTITEDKMKDILFPTTLPPHSPHCTCTRNCPSVAECVCPCTCLSTPFATPLHSTSATLAWKPNQIQPSFIGFEEGYDNNSDRFILRNRDPQQLVELAKTFDVTRAKSQNSESSDGATAPDQVFPTLLLPQIDVQKLLLKAEMMAFTSSAPYVVLDNRWPTNTLLTPSLRIEDYVNALMHQPLDRLVEAARTENITVGEHTIPLSEPNV